MILRHLLALVLIPAACVPSAPVATPTPPASPSPSPSTAPASPSAALASCNEPDAIRRISDALGAVPGYTLSASGFTYVQAPPRNPESPPRTRRVNATLELRYIAPDRVHRREAHSGAPEETAESVSIGADLWVHTDEGWEYLAGGGNPTEANALTALVRDAGPGWKPANVPTTDLPGDGCAFSVRARVSTGEKGYRETTLRADRATGLPSAARVVVNDAIDPFGNRHDSNMLYRVTYGSVAPIEPPSSPSPTP